MDAQAIGARRRSRASLVIVVVALAIAGAVLVVQARSILSTTPLVRPTIVQVVPQPAGAEWRSRDGIRKGVGRPILGHVDPDPAGNEWHSRDGIHKGAGGPIQRHNAVKSS